MPQWKLVLPKSTNSASISIVKEPQGVFHESCKYLTQLHVERSIISFPTHDSHGTQYTSNWTGGSTMIAYELVTLRNENGGIATSHKLTHLV